jgi:hypothetical protein
MSTSARSSDPRDNSDSALLTEIEQPVEAVPAAPSSENGSSPSSKGSYVVVESETIASSAEEVVVESVVVESVEVEVEVEVEVAEEAAAVVDESDPVEAAL